MTGSVFEFMNLEYLGGYVNFVNVTSSLVTTGDFVWFLPDTVLGCPMHFSSLIQNMTFINING